MRILAIESSCDDTSVALLDIDDNKIEILAERTASQVDVHKKYGGVVPEIAGRKHAEQITPVVEEVLIEATKKIMDNPGDHGNLRPINDGRVIKPDVIAVTSGPGLITGLIVGVEAAKTLSYLWDIPLIGVNHIEGHIMSSYLSHEDPQSTKFQISNFKFPMLSLIVSGGHTELILSKEHGHYEKIGGTRDDAAGEAFDKVAKMLDLPYPGGPKISKLALEGNTNAIPFPRPMIDKEGYDMSFAGLKTSALYWLRDNELAAMHTNAIGKLFSWLPGNFGQPSNAITLNDFCASFEQAIVDVLVKKSERAIKEFQPKTFILGGGVSANRRLRESLQQMTSAKKVDFRMSNLKYSMDNGAMIGVAAYHYAKQQDFIAWDKIEANPNWKVYHPRP